jgi:hypothetical protein
MTETVGRAPGFAQLTQAVGPERRKSENTGKTEDTPRFCEY